MGTVSYDFTGKVVLITGGGTGIGRGIGEAFARAGAKVVVSGRRIEPLQNFCAANPDNADFVQLDVGVEADRQRAVQQVIDRHGRLDLLVNNAISYTGATLDVLTLEEIESMFRVLLLGTVMMTKAALPHLVASRGSVINLSSVAGRFVEPLTGGAYGAAKAGVNQFTRVLAAELAPKGVRVNAIAPGSTATEAMLPEQEQMFIDMTPMGRLGVPADIAAVAMFLASDAGGWVTGQVIDAAGGLGISG
ncbi:3-oxoacyl-(acyl-carrier-protein) reductase [Sphingobium chlorophenolicum L-1]|uniref:3-oxoacyl-(Acyl-carrier-protein) reductase n=1 Tax=Sphingobium chlorophenolicum L-1 TaxID=690566 RepID=F6F364_SPHCR|nr:SDR family oxidoreductase [Sphingobium chlorophenolicum]AEG50876.1 3-oxoacyl-(acyl-carrier-protein) reductase [Sphingobium chlorophenolicum L-1]